MIPKKVVSEIRFNGYVINATLEESQYLIRSDKTDHVTIHKGRALTRLRTPVDHKGGGG